MLPKNSTRGRFRRRTGGGGVHVAEIRERRLTREESCGVDRIDPKIDGRERRRELRAAEKMIRRVIADTTIRAATLIRGPNTMKKFT